MRPLPFTPGRGRGYPTTTGDGQQRAARSSGAVSHAGYRRWCTTRLARAYVPSRATRHLYSASRNGSGGFAPLSWRHGKWPPLSFDTSSDTSFRVTGVQPVTVRDGKGGKKEWIFPEERGKRIYEGYKLSRLAEQLFGEDVTQEAIEKRSRAYEGQAQLQAHFVSGQPEYQDRIISHFVRQGEAALENGQAAEDPMTALRSTVESS